RDRNQIAGGDAEAYEQQPAEENETEQKDTARFETQRVYEHNQGESAVGGLAERVCQDGANSGGIQFAVNVQPVARDDGGDARKTQHQNHAVGGEIELVIELCAFAEGVGD